MRRLVMLPMLLGCALVWGCLGAAAEEGTEGGTNEAVVAESADELANGMPVSPTLMRSVRVNGGCSGTLVDPWWVLTARHCLPKAAGSDQRDKNPKRLTITLDSETRKVTHVALHPDHINNTDVMMLRLESPFTNVSDAEVPIYPGNTAELIGSTVFCTGYGGTGSQLTGEWFEIVEDSFYGDPHKFYQVEPLNTPNADLIDGDSGSSCRWAGYITGVHKGAGQVSVEAWGDWAVDRRDCPGFDPNAPTTTFCSAACPCDVGEGDCDNDGQCQPGLHCVTAKTSAGLPANYDVCERVNPPSCGTFNVNAPADDFCRYVTDGEICACAHGQGDCEFDHQCGGSLECQKDTGYAVGLPDNYDVCVYPPAPGCDAYDPDVDESEFCSTACPCDIGQGDCDSDAECRGGLVCKAGIASHFGKPSNYAICAKP